MKKGNVWDSHWLDKDFEEFFKKFKNPKDYSVIDLGCGNGSQAYFLEQMGFNVTGTDTCLLYTSPSPRDLSTSRMPSSA